MGLRKPVLFFPAFFPAGVLVALMVLHPSAEAGKYSLDGIKGADNRLVVEATEYPWSAIGRLNKKGGFCTGVLVGPRTVLTAAHCLWNRSTGAFMPPEFLHFVAGYQKGAYVAYSKAAGVLIAPRFVYRGPKGPASKSLDDWALVELEKDIGSIAGYFGLARPDASLFTPPRGSTRDHGKKTVTSQAGYSRDRQYVLSANMNCDIWGYLEGLDLLAHGCDAIAGDSGSPIFIHRDGSFRVVGILSANTEGRKDAYGIAVPSSRFMGALKDRVPGHGKAPANGKNAPIGTIRQLLALSGFDADADPAAAVRAFQQAKGLPVTGKASLDLLGDIFEALP